MNELLQLKEAFEKENHFFVTNKRINSVELAKKEKVYFVECPGRNPLKLAKNVVQALKVFLKEKPDIVISTGADTAIPLCLIAKMFGKKVVFIESFCRIDELSLSGKIMYGKADLFFVQWPELKGKFSGTKYEGSVF